MSEEAKTASNEEGDSLNEQGALNLLKSVFDPELKANIVDLGLVYGVDIGSGGRVKVRMTLTSPGCPYGPTLAFQVRQALLTLKGCAEAEVEWVWEPAWSPARMTEELRLELGFDV